METFILGGLVVAAGWGAATWARVHNISIRWYEWVFAALAVLVAMLTAMDYRALTAAMEPRAADVILWLFGGPALVLALIAVASVWWQNRKTLRAPDNR